MKKPIVRKLRYAVYTRKSSEEGLDMEFNSLDAQREACEAYVASQKAEGWLLVPDRYDDGGFSGGTLERPALQRLIADIEATRVDVVVVYKIDRLSRSLMDFAKLVEVFDRNSVTFVSVTQSFNTTTSMGRLTPFVARVIIANPLQVKAIAQAHVKTDKIDAGTLASLQAAGYLPQIWRPDAITERKRRLTARRFQVVRHRTRIKNEVHWGISKGADGAASTITPRCASPLTDS